MRKLARTLQLFGRHRPEFGLLLGFSALISAAEAFLQPYLIKLIFDEAVGARDIWYLLKLAGYYLAGGVGVILLGYGADLWERSLQNRVVRTMTVDLLTAYYHQDYRAILREGEGYFVGRIYRDAFEGLSPSIPVIRGMANSVVMMVVFLGMLFYLSWQGALFLMAAMPVVAYVSRVFGKKIEKVTEREREDEGAVLSVLNRCLATFKFTWIRPVREKALDAYGRGVAKFLGTAYRNYKLAVGYRTVTSLGMVGADFLAVVVGGDPGVAELRRVHCVRQRVLAGGEHGDGVLPTPGRPVPTGGDRQSHPDLPCDHGNAVLHGRGGRGAKRGHVCLQR